MTVRILTGDCRDMLATLPDESVSCVVTSPPYWGLRSYGIGADRGELGLEETPAEYVANMVDAFRAVRRVLRRDGTLWINMGDCYATGAGKVSSCPGGGRQGEGWHGVMTSPNRMPQDGLKPKDLVGIPWRLAFALQADGWWLRSDCIWSKPNPMPESVTDRPTKAHEYVFLLTKSAKYFYDAEAVKEDAVRADQGAWCDSGGGKQRGNSRRHEGFNGRYAEAIRKNGPPSTRNLRSVWNIPTAPFSEAHFATFPPALAEICIKAGTSENGCCPICGAPWVRVVEKRYINPGSRRTNGPRSLSNRTMTAGFAVRLNTSTTTTGWSPSCACPPADLVPCTVLDPFAGAGTTLMVADRLQRDAIGIELNPEYVAMAQERIGRDQGPLLEMMTE